MCAAAALYCGSHGITVGIYPTPNVTQLSLCSFPLPPLHLHLPCQLASLPHVPSPPSSLLLSPYADNITKFPSAQRKNLLAPKKLIVACRDFPPWAGGSSSLTPLLAATVLPPPSVVCLLPSPSTDDIQ